MQEFDDMEIYILDRNLNILDVISTYEAIVWTPKVNEPGTFKAEFVFSEKYNNILTRGNLLYKTDEEEAGIIKRVQKKLDKTGRETLIVSGYMTGKYLFQRIIWNKMLMKGTYEDLMRQMVYEQVINPSDSSRRMPMIELGDYHGYNSDVIEKQITYDNLQEALTDLSNLSELGYRLRLDFEAKKYIFEVYQGTDRTRDSEHPCVFSRERNNIYAQNYSEDDNNYKNVCLVGGPGEDENRILRTVGSGEGFDRYEMFYNAASYSDKDVTADELNAQLDQKGREKLAQYYVAKAFDSKINQSKAPLYKLGDYVTVYDSKWNTYLDTQIKSIEKGLSKKEDSTIITFGDGIPTLIQLIKKG